MLFPEHAAARGWQPASQQWAFARQRICWSHDLGLQVTSRTIVFPSSQMRRLERRLPRGSSARSWQLPEEPEQNPGSRAVGGALSTTVRGLEVPLPPTVPGPPTLHEANAAKSEAPKTATSSLNYFGDPARLFTAQWGPCSFLGPLRLLRTEAFPACRIFKKLHRSHNPLQPHCSQGCHVPSPHQRCSVYVGHALPVHPLLHLSQTPSQLGPPSHHCDNPHPPVSHRSVTQGAKGYESTVTSRPVPPAPRSLGCGIPAEALSPGGFLAPHTQ